jgi:hypothetical protein
MREYYFDKIITEEQCNKCWEHNFKEVVKLIKNELKCCNVIILDYGQYLKNEMFINYKQYYIRFLPVF